MAKRQSIEDALVFATAVEKGIAFETGRRVTFPFMLILNGPTPHFGSQFQQDIEPHGKYVLLDYAVRNEPFLERGMVTLANPLVIELTGDAANIYGSTSWKARLHAWYRAKGRALSKKILTDGYDGIITVRAGETSEIVDLTSFR